MTYTSENIARIVGADTNVPGVSIAHLLIDSRRVQSPATSLFFAIKGDRRNGHQFIPELYRQGVRAFVISDAVDPVPYPDAAFIKVPDTLLALQQVATYHRRQFDLPVIGITGSNGKTTVKEWLFQLLDADHFIVRSPRSYNSQIGVPLSVWQIEESHNLGIFEAGISQPGEMGLLEPVIRPAVGVFTALGDAHSEGFRGNAEKLREKLLLFKNAQIIIAPGDNADIDRALEATGKKLLRWGSLPGNEVLIEERSHQPDGTTLRVRANDAVFSFHIPFSDEASVANAMTCVSVLIYFGLSPTVIASRMPLLQPVNMRLELKKAINQCTIINDSYSNDLNSLEIALAFMEQQATTGRRTVILSDLLQASESGEALYQRILELLKKYRVTRLFAIGGESGRFLPAGEQGDLRIQSFPDTESYLKQLLSSQFREETILVKGARVFHFEEIVQQLELKAHQTVLEIDLNAIVHNVKVFQQKLRPSTKIMAMVKAFAYGSGGAEIAGILQFHKVDYLGVAYADEGVELRRAGISLPIMVMNADEAAFETIVEQNLEPVLYSFELLRRFEAFLHRQGIQHYPVHVELETGMNRLGFLSTEVEALAAHLSKSGLLKVQSVFSHLAASEDRQEDEFTLRQFNRYNEAAAVIRAALSYSFLQHIANTAAIARLQELQLDMVRLGIGMYGIGPVEDLLPAATFRSTIAQIKELEPGDTVSYNRRGKIQRRSLIATVRVGYADGYSRRLGHGRGHMYVAGKLAPVVGTVCMDMTMIDITGTPGVEVGDDVILFGRELPVQQVAEWAETIPYEIMTGISQRVKRVYFEE